MNHKLKASARGGQAVLMLCLVTLMPAMGWAEVGFNWIEQYGITWTFDKDISTDGSGDTYQYGTFANGDYWVVGPVDIIRIDPEPRIYGDGSIRHGSMLNPSQNGRQGYDSRASVWDAEYNIGIGISAQNSLEVSAGSSLISTISLPARDYGSWLESAAILTVLASAPAVNSFRPPYYGTDKTVNYNEYMLNYGVLSSLPRAGIGSIPTLEQQDADEAQGASVERMFQRPWIDHVENWMVRSIHPVSNMEPYGRDLSNQIGIGALMLNLDYTNEEKRDLLVRYTQLGIDLYGIVSAGTINTWLASGGHQMGRKWPILFAGLVLNDAGMKAIGEKSGDYLYSAKPGGGNYGPDDLPPDYIQFQEDDQTWYVRENDVGREIHVTLCKGLAESGASNTIGVYHPGRYAPLGGLYIEIISGPGAGQRRYIIDSNVPRTGGAGILTVSPDWSTTPVAGESYYEVKGYEQFHVGMPEWGITHGYYPVKDNPAWHAEYRTLNGYSWSGWVLAAHIMGAKGLWNHDALFDYQDRYVQISAPDGKFPGRNFLSRFTENMWYTYRADYPPIWPDGASNPEPEPHPDPQPEPETNPDPDPELEDAAANDIPDRTLLKISNNIIKSGGNSAVTINCDVKEPGKLTVKIYDSKGREIITLWNRHEEARTVPITWYGQDSGGGKVGSGIYLIHMECGSYKETKKIAVIK